MRGLSKGLKMSRMSHSFQHVKCAETFACVHMYQVRTFMWNSSDFSKLQSAARDAFISGRSWDLNLFVKGYKSNQRCVMLSNVEFCGIPMQIYSSLLQSIENQFQRNVSSPREPRSSFQSRAWQKAGVWFTFRILGNSLFFARRETVSSSSQHDI